jgi:hypothetical protein
MEKKKKKRTAQTLTRQETHQQAGEKQITEAQKHRNEFPPSM